IAEYFWAEAVSTACYIINRIYIRPLTTKTSYELFRGRKPYVSYFHVFGCTCFVKKNAHNLGKFDERSDEAIFLGYSQHSKAYRVYNKTTKVVEESLNVRFIDMKDDFDDNDILASMNKDNDFTYKVEEKKNSDMSEGKAESNLEKNLQSDMSEGKAE